LAIAASCGLAATTLTPGAQGAAHQAPCTKKALSTGLSRGSSKFPEGRVITPFGCAGKYAYAPVIVGGNEIVVVYREHGTRWFTVDRGPACEGGKIPSKIYAPACEYS
jgi:hypothetical protein